ncbi:hypothetical protein HMPREF3220_02957 [Citrobacter koseri]|nr:hypothetical protein HMPREF3220_02957 [Citrobacter koseri]
MLCDISNVCHTSPLQQSVNGGSFSIAIWIAEYKLQRFSVTLQLIVSMP